MLISGDSDDEVSFIGNFVTRLFGVEGQIYSKGTHALVIKNFKYDGRGPAGVFWVGTEGHKPSPLGIQLIAADQKDPERLEAYFGNQPDIELTLPTGIEVSDLKWISVWCKTFNVVLGEFILEN